MRNITISLIIFWLLLISCTKEEKPIEKWFVGFEPTCRNQRLMFGDSILVSLYVMNGMNYIENIKVNLEIVNGNGNLSNPLITTNNLGKATTYLTPGNKSSNVILKATALNKNDVKIGEANLNAICFIPNTWIKVPIEFIGPDIYIMDLIADTASKISYMIGSNARLYKQGKKFYEWDLINNDLLTNVKKVDIDQNENIYAIVNNSFVGGQELLISSDLVKTWTLCTRPYDPSVDFQMTICNDNTIWVNTFKHPVKYSKDKGKTWITAGNLSINSGTQVFRLKNGAYLLFGYDCNLIISYDEGQTWTTIDTPKNICNLYLTDKDEIIIGTRDVTYNIYKSLDYGSSFRFLTMVLPSDNLRQSKFIKKSKNTYYISIPSYGAIATKDFNTFSYFENKDFINLFLDHNGVMIGKGSDYSSVYYRY